MAVSGPWRVVFSSSSDLIRANRAETPQRRSGFVSLLGAAAESLFATLFPCDCRLCGAPLLNISRLPVCAHCLDTIRPVSGATCSLCGERLLSPYALSPAPGETLCGLCRRLEPPFAKASAYGSYDGGLRELIHLLKYERVRPAAEVLGRMLAEAAATLMSQFGAELPVVVPVPLHSSKLRERGFNQSELIARAALKLMAAGRQMQLNSKALERSRRTESQTGLSRHQRRQNVRGAFVVARPQQVMGREVLLVDDVFTTGTTVSECARVLRRSGATRVWVATVARVLKPEAAAATPQAESEPETLAMAAGG